MKSDSNWASGWLLSLLLTLAFEKYLVVLSVNVGGECCCNIYMEYVYVFLYICVSKPGEGNSGSKLGFGNRWASADEFLTCSSRNSSMLYVVPIVNGAQWPWAKVAALTPHLSSETFKKSKKWMSVGARAKLGSAGILPVDIVFF